MSTAPPHGSAAPPDRPTLRLARALVFSTVCVALATLGHALAASAAVPAWAALTGFAGVLAVTYALTGHERSLPTIVGGLVGGQFALHTLYTSACGPCAPASHPGGAVSSIHDGHAMAVVIPAHGPGAGMTFAHVAAGLVSGWWLWRGERAAWSLARRAASFADRPVRLLLALRALLAAASEVVAPLVRVPVVQSEPMAALRRALRHQVVRRGPPLLRSRIPATA
ncbi:MFS transporter [Actinomadura harenae]|uniref:MFS transporter n=1 Tax=Actinomadura harenae TaxID=2483351 RepID=A0A3M2LQN7_9ACTN|nr:MFS transporter [Actinomadura harenae]RMI39707.1 MFS transporter [Actinomadura harenae]